MQAARTAGVAVIAFSERNASVSGLAGSLVALGAGLALLVSAPAAAAGGPAEVAPTAQLVTVTARRLLDIETGRYLDHPVLRIADGKVVSVGLRMASDVVTYDLGEVTLLPGLIDCHTHLVGGEGLSADQALRETTARAAIEGVANAAATLRAGLTSPESASSCSSARRFCRWMSRRASARCPCSRKVWVM